jgi:hypothetical protein
VRAIFNFQHPSLASGRIVFSSCGADPSRAKKRLSAPKITGHPETKASHSRSACVVTSRLWEETERGYGAGVLLFFRLAH